MYCCRFPGTGFIIGEGGLKMNSERCLTGRSQIHEDFQKYRRKLVLCHTHEALFSKMLYSFDFYFVHYWQRTQNGIIDGKTKNVFQKFTIAFFMKLYQCLMLVFLHIFTKKECKMLEVSSYFFIFGTLKRCMFYIKVISEME